MNNEDYNMIDGRKDDSDSDDIMMVIRLMMRMIMSNTIITIAKLMTSM